MTAPARRRVSWPSLLLGLFLGAGVMFVSLAQAGRLKPPSDPEVLVALAQTLETEHKRVDLLIEKGDIAGAIAALEELRGQKWPSREVGGDASLQLRHDAYGRLIRLRLDHPTVDPKSPEVLLDLVTEGLGKDWEKLDDNAFTARLMALRGEIYEQLGRDELALGAYTQALDMNRRLLDDLLGDSP